MKQARSPWEVFLQLYAEADEVKKRGSLTAALAVLQEEVRAKTNGAAENYLSGRELAAHYNLDESTVWRWQFPSEDWHGVRRYKLSQCDAYLGSEEFKARKAMLRLERATQLAGLRRHDSQRKAKKTSGRFGNGRCPILKRKR
jgi:hypothetical protein